MIYIASLGYSLHVSNDQNKKNSVRKIAKTNLSAQLLDDREKDIEFIRGAN